MYRERPSRVKGGFVWSRTSDRNESRGMVLPDGCTDLIFSGRELLVAGPDTIGYSGGPTGLYLGLRLPSGAGPALWGVPGAALLNQRVALSDLRPRAEVSRLTEEVYAAADPGAALELIATRRWRDTPPDPVMLDLADHLRRGCSVASVARQAGFSERQLHRRSLVAYGYGAKTLARILRFNAALDRARSGIGFSVAAVDSGYADQAHLAREVREFSGCTLTRLLVA